jgi:hypothetical protein
MKYVMNRYGVLLLIAAAACGDDDGVGARDAGSTNRDGGSDSGASSDAGSGDLDAGGAVDAAGDPDAAGSDAGLDAAPLDAGAADIVMCTAGEVVFPDIGRACVDERDCYVAVHQVDCCGTFIATGISLSQSDRFERAEATCRSMYPRCRCLARPTEADDGTVGESSTDVPGLQCIDSICRTSFDGH